MFLLFASNGIWCVVLHEMLVPKSKVGSGVLLPGFSWLCEEDDVKLLNGRRMRFVGKGDKYLMTTKAKHSSFLYSNSFCCLEAFRRNA